MDDLSKSAGHKYFLETYFDRELLIENRRPEIAPAPLTCTYEGRPTVTLQIPESDSSLWSALKKRRSRRKFSSKKVSLENTASLLWAAQGVTGQTGPFLLRTTPSAGALHPLETYVVVNRVEGLKPGLYHLDVEHFCLEQMRQGDLSEKLAKATIHQGFVGRSALIVIFSSIFRRNLCKYGDRGMRYILMDVGHACQNLLLAAEALQLNACPVAAFFDQEMNEIIGADGEEESVLYLAAIGKPGQ